MKNSIYSTIKNIFTNIKYLDDLKKKKIKTYCVIKVS